MGIVKLERNAFLFITQLFHNINKIIINKVDSECFVKRLKY